MSLLTPNHHFDRSAILTAAWASARHAVTHNEAARRDKWWSPLGLREAFRDALRRQWDLAKGHRACKLHRIAQAAEAQRRAALPAIERRVADLTEARMFAVHIDSTTEMLRTLSAIDARLADMQVSL